PKELPLPHKTTLIHTFKIVLSGNFPFHLSCTLIILSPSLSSCIWTWDFMRTWFPRPRTVWRWWRSSSSDVMRGREQGEQESREGRESKGNGRGRGRGNVGDEGFYPVYVCGGSGPTR